MAISVAATAGVLAGVLILVNRGDWWRGLLAATVVSGLSAIASVVALAWGLRRGQDGFAGGYFIAVGLRLILSLAGGALAVAVGGFPAAPTLLLVVVFYFVVLGVETALLARILGTGRIGSQACSS